MLATFRAVYPVTTPPPSTPESGNKRQYAPGTISNTAGRPLRLAKPSNWDEVMMQYGAGAITQADAARMTGMCVSTFSKYSKGHSQFAS